jgi:hypothetical protein
MTKSVITGASETVVEASVVEGASVAVLVMTVVMSVTIAVSVSARVVSEAPVVSEPSVISTVAEDSIEVAIVAASVLNVSKVVAFSTMVEAVVAVDRSGRQRARALAAGSSAALRTVAKEDQRIVNINESNRSVDAKGVTNGKRWGDRLTSRGKGPTSIVID